MKKTALIFKMGSSDEHKKTSNYSVITKAAMMNVRGGDGDPIKPFLK